MTNGFTRVGHGTAQRRWADTCKDINVQVKELFCKSNNICGILDLTTKGGRFWMHDSYEIQ